MLDLLVSLTCREGVTDARKQSVGRRRRDALGATARIKLPPKLPAAPQPRRRGALEKPKKGATPKRPPEPATSEKEKA